ncbi:ribulose-phosphate 3-epimerase [Alterileibacterium massiliense]|uniref:ribulose-phosphate 3-epimerase n=1 Tax=Alterileibacterium massiliense TaxID=1870997 RepID=UPI0008DAB4E0|nr:ribulose-phosphate 3-epimerase [Alterileibacterium massiliense]
MIQISPSILSADFSRLGDEVKEICELGADYIHVDVMDGHFVPNISFGAGVMESLNEISSVPYDVHLMIEDPDKYLDTFVTDKTEFITVHQEACVHLDRTIEHIKSLGNGVIKAGVSLNPATPVDLLSCIIDKVDLVLIMSVNPGFGGQKFIPQSIDKVRELSRIREEKNLKFLIEVDGGVNGDNAHLLKEAGADILVAGSYIFKSGDRKKAIESIK